MLKGILGQSISGSDGRKTMHCNPIYKWHTEANDLDPQLRWSYGHLSLPKIPFPSLVLIIFYNSFSYKLFWRNQILELSFELCRLLAHSCLLETYLFVFCCI